VKARKKLGEILVEGGLLTQEQLDKALPYQKKSNLKLGQFLVREGIARSWTWYPVSLNWKNIGRTDLQWM
jgi:hypothetical protein